jgi:serine protease Do
MGLSFAIPIDVAMDIQQQLRTSGKVTRGRIGVGIQPVTKEMAESFGLPKAAGALVNAVEPGSPAEKGGLQVSDVILRFEGKPVNSADDLVRFVGNTKPGSKAQLQVWRAKGARELTVTVGEMPDERTAARAPKRGAPGKPAPDTATVSKLGLTLSDLREEQLKELKLTSGVLVEEATGAAVRAGIRRGDVIVAVNKQSVKSVEQFSQLIGQFEKGRSVALLVRRAGGSIYVPLRIE